MKNEQAIILFDGICKLCNGSVNFIREKDKKKVFQFVALQSDKGKKLVESFHIPKETDSLILIKNNTVFTESDAAIEIGKLLPAPWKWASLFKIIPKICRNGIYRWVAKNRYRWFGKRETLCNLHEK